MPITKPCADVRVLHAHVTFDTSTSTQCSDFTRTHQSHFTRIASSTAHTFESLPMSRKLAKPNVGYNLPSSTTAHPLKYLAECGGK